MSTRQIAQAQGADARPHELFHFVADLVKHPANLPIDFLLENDAEEHRLDREHAVEPRALAIEHDAAEKLRGELRFPWVIERYFIFLFDFEARMHQPLRQVTVVRQDQQAFALRIKSSDIEKPRH